jgi:hypothetical protein
LRLGEAVTGVGRSEDSSTSRKRNGQKCVLEDQGESAAAEHSREFFKQWTFGLNTTSALYRHSILKDDPSRANLLHNWTEAPRRPSTLHDSPTPGSR